MGEPVEGSEDAVTMTEGDRAAEKQRDGMDGCADYHGDGAGHPPHAAAADSHWALAPEAHLQQVAKPSCCFAHSACLVPIPITASSIIPYLIIPYYLSTAVKDPEAAHPASIYPPSHECFALHK